MNFSVGFGKRRIGALEPFMNNYNFESKVCKKKCRPCFLIICFKVNHNEKVLDQGEDYSIFNVKAYYSSISKR